MAEPQILIIDTTGPEAALELRSGERVVAASTLAPTRHGQALFSGLKRLLHETGRTWSDLQALAVNLGPGSFTGIRVALAAAKAIVYVGRQKLIGIDQFDAFAANLVDLDYQSINVIVAGQMQSVTVVRFEKRTGRVIRRELCSIPHDQMASHFDMSIPLTGPKRMDLPPGTTWLDLKPRQGDVATARYVVAQFDEPFSLEPFYVRPSSAEEKWQARTTG